MKLYSIITLTVLCQLKATNTARLHKIFQFVDGFRSEHNLAGFLHIGNDYSIFLITPKAHDKYLQYELYESQNEPGDTYKPTLLAVAQIPVEYLKSQLKVFREELYRAKYVDYNVVPGTQVKTVREWQIKQAIQDKRVMLDDLPILRSIVPE